MLVPRGSDRLRLPMDDPEAFDTPLRCPGIGWDASKPGLGLGTRGSHGSLNFQAVDATQTKSWGFLGEGGKRAETSLIKALLGALTLSLGEPCGIARTPLSSIPSQSSSWEDVWLPDAHVGVLEILHARQIHPRTPNSMLEDFFAKAKKKRCHQELIAKDFPHHHYVPRLCHFLFFTILNHLEHTALSGCVLPLNCCSCSSQVVGFRPDESEAQIRHICRI